MFGTSIIFAKLSAIWVPFAAACPGGNFFFFPHWWKYITTSTVDSSGKCVPTLVFPNDIPAVGLAILDMLLRAAGLVAIISIIAAGVIYITASGNPEKAASARKRIYNSLIGLAIVFIAAAVVAFIGNSLGG
jgi:hypothetical protein